MISYNNLSDLVLVWSKTVTPFLCKRIEIGDFTDVCVDEFNLYITENREIAEPLKPIIKSIFLTFVGFEVNLSDWLEELYSAYPDYYIDENFVSLPAKEDEFAGYQNNLSKIYMSKISFKYSNHLLVMEEIKDIYYTTQNTFLEFIQNLKPLM